MKLQSKTIFLLLLSAMIASCHQSSNQTVSEQSPSVDLNANRESITLIERGEYSRALSRLDDRLQRVPQDNEARILMASALAQRNGIVLSSFINLERDLLRFSIRNQNSKKIGLSAQIQMIMATIEAIPVLQTIEAQTDILNAIQVLSVNGLSYGSYMYRAILRLVIFKYNFLNQDRLQTTSECKIEPKEIRHWLNFIMTDFAGILDDLALASKNQGQKHSFEYSKLKIETNRDSLIANYSDAKVTESIDMPEFLKKFYPICGQ